MTKFQMLFITLWIRAARYFPYRKVMGSKNGGICRAVIYVHGEKNEVGQEVWEHLPYKVCTS